VRSGPALAGGVPRRGRLGTVLAWVVRIPLFPFRLVRPGFTVARQASRWGPVKCVLLVLAAARLFAAFLRAGARLGPAWRFLHSRHFSSQILLPRRARLVFLTSIPYTYGQHPWVIEIEDPITLFYPFFRNGQVGDREVGASPWFPLVKTLLQAESCRGIITHIRSTAEALPRLFSCERIAAKTHHVPLGVPLPGRWQRHEDDEHFDLLFTCSWHQHSDSFFLRGGLELLDAFDFLKVRYPHLRLTLRTALPPSLGARYRAIIDRHWVRVLSWYLQPDEMDALFRTSHVFVLPAARVHIVSVLKAMSFGQVPVTSDGWGFEEYVRHGHNGLIVRGRYGKTSWMDERTGVLRENYTPMRASDPVVVRGLVEAISELVEDRPRRRRLGQAARRDVETRYTPEHWNRGLKAALDQALARG
jgi:glycosyltransferase involved in cell wall biosynthesis